MNVCSGLETEILGLQMCGCVQNDRGMSELGAVSVKLKIDYLNNN